MSRRARLAALVVALGSACVVADTGELKIVPEGTLTCGAYLTIEVDGPFERFALELDGKRLPGEHAANRVVHVDLPADVVDGDHELRARALDGAVARSARRTLVVAKGSEANIEAIIPAPGEYAADDPITDSPLSVEVRFRVPLVVARVNTSTVRFEGGTSSVTVQPDGRTLRVVGTEPLDVVRTAALHIAANITEPAARSDWWLVWDRLPGPLARFRWIEPAGYSTSARGELPLRLEPIGTVTPSWIDVSWGGLHVARMDAAGGWSQTWDTQGFPEGVHPLDAVAHGDHELEVEGSRAVRVDRTAPVLVHCGAEDRIHGGERLRTRCSLVEFDEDVAVGSATVTGPDGAYPAVQAYPGGTVKVCAQWPDPVPLWPSHRLDGVATDLAGNITPFTCPRETPLWRDDLGFAVPPLGGTWSEVGVGLANLCLDTQAETFGVVTIGAPGSAWAGQAVAWHSGTWQQFVLSPSTGVASTIQGNRWVESLEGGPPQAWGFGWNMMGAPPSAGPVSESGLPTRDPTWPYPAWLEELGDGRSVLRLAGWSGDPPAFPSGLAIERPAHTRQDFWREIAPGSQVHEWWSLVVWVERGATTPGRLGALRSELSHPELWEPVPSIANVDPGADAAAPGLWTHWEESVIVWTEGGDALLRRAATGWEFGPPVVLDAEPAHASRLTRIDPYAPVPTVYWIEQLGDGEEAIRARRWDGQGWSLLPTAVNAGVPGAVRDYSVSAGVVGWIDGTGGLHLRRTDCF
jgi:hypothetical protein